MNIAGMQKIMATMSEADLLKAQKIIAAEIRERRSRAAQGAIGLLREGQRISLLDEGGKRITIEVGRINAKSVSGREVHPNGMLGVTVLRVPISSLIAA